MDAKEERKKVMAVRGMMRRGEVYGALIMQLGEMAEQMTCGDGPWRRDADAMVSKTGAEAYAQVQDARLAMSFGLMLSDLGFEAFVQVTREALQEAGWYHGVYRALLDDAVLATRKATLEYGMASILVSTELRHGGKRTDEHQLAVELSSATAHVAVNVHNSQLAEGDITDGARILFAACLRLDEHWRKRNALGFATRYRKHLPYECFLIDTTKPGGQA